MSLHLPNEAALANLRAGKPAAARKPRTPKVLCETGAARTSGAVSVTFEFPLPPIACSPNNHDSGRMAGIIAGSARAKYRAECLRSLPPINYHAFGRMFDRATITTEWFLGPMPGRYHPRDEQNASSSIKALVDAIVDAGYLIDDGAKYLHWGETHLRRSGARACVVVTLERRQA